MKPIQSFPGIACVVVLLLAVEGPSHAQCVSSDASGDMVLVPVVFEFKNPAFRKEEVYCSIFPTLKIGANYYPSGFRTINGRFEAGFCVSPDVLEGVSRFRIDFGPRQFSVSVRPIVWTKPRVVADRFGRSIQVRDGKMATVSLLDQPDPDWPILQTARLLRSTKDGISVLEVIVDNRSDRPIAVTTLTLKASHPSGGVPCDNPDRVQEVTINWERVLARLDNAAWTTLGKQSIKVPVSYNDLGQCSSFYFGAEIPVYHEMPPKQVSRISLMLTELPASLNSSLTDARADASKSAPPSFLASWKRLTLYLNRELPGIEVAR